MTRTFLDGVHAQPANLRAGQAALRDALAATDIAALREGTIVFSGIGASWHALAPALHALRAAGRRAFAVAPGELEHAGGALGDAYVVVSQSGRSAEVLAAVERLGAAPVFAIGARRDSPVAQRAGAWLPLGDTPDTPLSTLGYTSTLQALGLLCEAILDGAPAPDWAALPDLAGDLLASLDPDARALAERFAAVRFLDSVGGGELRSSAGETALLAREGLRMPASAAETRQYLHGELEPVGPGFGCVLFGGARELALAEEMRAHGAAAITIGHESERSAVAIGLPRVRPLLAPILQILPVQLAVHHLAAARGLALDDLQRPQADTKVAV